MQQLTGTTMSFISSPPSLGLRRQRGAGSLLVVTVLTMVLAVTVIFGHKTILFEQKTATNQYRSTMAFEAADAGLAWATAMLNKQEKITTACVNDAATSASVNFKSKYLNANITTGAIAPIHSGTVTAACVYNLTGGGLQCSCPAAGAAPSFTSAAIAALGAGYTPGFAVAFTTNSVTGTVDVVSYGCSSVITNSACGGDAAAQVSVSLGQVSGLSTPPGAPLTARGNVQVSNAAGVVVNPDPNTNGVTINAGGDIAIDPSKLQILTTPGTPPASTLVGNDSSLQQTTEDGMFATYFGMSKEAYKNLPATKVLSCAAGCSATDVQNAYKDGARQIWVLGDLKINANTILGSSTDPFVMVVDGSIHVNGGPEIFAVIYSTAITWDETGSGNALLRGAAISEGGFKHTGNGKYYYDPDVMRRIRSSASSFVKVPGSWRDF